MLALDIETMGLLDEAPLPAITCVCFYDGAERLGLLFCGVSEEEAARNRATVLRRLDDADVLAGYNAIYFDLEFIRRAFGATDAQMQGWARKCIDPFMAMKHILRRPCKMQQLLSLNALGCKTASGSDAIRMAREGRVQELLAYCMMDAVLTHQLCALPALRLTEIVTAALEGGTWALRRFRAPPVRLEEVMTEVDLRWVYEDVEFLPEPVRVAGGEACFWGDRYVPVYGA